MRPGKFAPFIHTEYTTPYIGVKLIIALLPCAVYAALSYGLRAIVLMLFSVVLSMFFDIASEKIRCGFKKNENYFDFSSISNGLIFALLLPPDCSLMIAAVGILFGSLVIKQLFGGQGASVFNVPVLARLIVETLFSSSLVTLSNPGTNLFEVKSLFIDSEFSRSVIKVGTDISEYSFVEIIAGRYPSFIGTGCILMALLGFAYLCYSKSVRIFMPLSYSISGVVFALLFFRNEGVTFALFNVMVSGLFFVACFIMSDITNMTNSPSKAIIIGIISGVVFAFAYKYSGNAIAIASSVVIANILSYISDYFAIGNISENREVNE